jgi:hypothetical protein
MSRDFAPYATVGKKEAKPKQNKQNLENQFLK